MPAIALPLAYVEALHRADAREAIIFPATLNGSIEATLRRFDGLLLAGGGDIDPSCYAEPPHPRTDDVHDGREEFEICAVRAALALQLPLLAICRGMQVLNVSLGGSLVQHLPDVASAREHSGYERASVTHDVEIEPGSSLAKALRVERTTVLSRHHQAVGRLGEGIRPVAWAEDGVVEGIEHDSSWALGVQWHPEMSVHLGAEHQRLFGEFANAARSQVHGSRYGS